MTTFIALLRGINVGGHKRIKMADLKGIFENIGFSRVQTYIQSGNVLFETEDDADFLSPRIEQEIQKVFGLDVPVILRTTHEWETLIKNCPFDALPGLSVAFLAAKPTQEAIDGLLSLDMGNYEIHIRDKDIYVLYKEDIRKTLLTTNFLEKKLNVPLTVRNWNTVNKLAELAKR